MTGGVSDEVEPWEPRELAPDALRAISREITIGPAQATLGTFALAESDVDITHNNKYGRDYDRPEPDSPTYARP